MIKGKLRPIRDCVIVEEMNFGEQKTKAGLIILSDDGIDRGIKPRWAKIYAIGPENVDEYKIGDYVLIEHGRWTRGVEIDDGDAVRTLRRAEPESILIYSDTLPEEVSFGKVYDDNAPTHIPEDFVNSDG